MELPCPLCLSTKCTFYLQDTLRIYQQCNVCHLVFVEPDSLPSASIEKAEYDLHQNDLQDEGYRQFLKRIAMPLSEQLKQPSKGIDFGCGPGPLLAEMLKEQGHDVTLYDPFYFDNAQALKTHYDFIVCTEAIEHFHKPNLEWHLWQTMLKPEGWLAIMTKRVMDKTRFANWHYKNDPTHVSFFSDQTFKWLAEQYHYRLMFFGKDVVLMQKRAKK